MTYPKELETMKSNIGYIISINQKHITIYSNKKGGKQKG
jgi:hypothetical protein